MPGRETGDLIGIVLVSTGPPGSGNGSQETRFPHHGHMFGQVVLPRLPVGVGEQGYLFPQDALQHCLAREDFHACLMGLQARQDRMIDRVGTDLHARIAQDAHLPGGHHQVVPQGRPYLVGDPLHQTAPLVEGKVFQLRQQLVDGLATFGEAGNREGPQSQVAQIQNRAPGQTDRLDHRIVPHAAAVQEAGGNEKGGRQAVGLQDGQGHRYIVGVAIIEGDGEGAEGQLPYLEEA